MISKATEQRVRGLIAKGLSHRKIRSITGVSLGKISAIRNTMVYSPSPSTEGTGNVLVIGDLHAPFIRKGYLEFCIEQKEKWGCTEIVFTGDIVDNHASSFHTTDPDGMSAGDELAAAIEQLKPWVDAFPKAKVCIGNHDRLPFRQAFEAGVSTKWVRDYSDVLGCPDWEFAPSFVIDGVCYEHGEGPKPHVKMRDNRQSYVCGHNHSELSVVHSVSDHDRLFAMQVGWGGDQSAYSMAYAKNSKKGVVSCGVVLDHGQTPIPIPMFLK